jgi:succinate dehydrogenase / fumarate reductase, cytochrome b subunit
MSTPSSAKNRPMSPFMIGPYYKPQLTSMLSITHRGTGVVLTFGALFLAWWLVSLAAGPDDYAKFAALAHGPIGTIVVVGLAYCLIFHWLNGLRHLFWDVGVGLEIKRTYASGWTVVVLSLVATAVFWYTSFGPGGGS